MQSKSLMTAMFRILYVDDEPDLLEIGRSFLEESGDFTVTTTPSASEAIRLLEQDKFDAIISDYKMPGIDGIRFLIEVRARFGSIPFILFTGRGREEVVIQAINSGADFYVQKGGDPEAQFAELSHKVKSAASRMRALEALRESEEKFRNVFDWANDAIMLHTLTTEGSPGRFIEVNRVACRMLGYTRNELLIRGPSDIVPVEFHPVLGEIIQQAALKESVLFETRFMRKDGTTFPVESSAHLVIYEGKRIWVSHIRDITEHKKAEEVLKESETRFKNLFNHMSSGVVIYEPAPDGEDFIIRNINYAVESIDNVQRENVIGHSLLEIFPGVKDFGLFDIFQRVAKTGIAESHPVSRYKDNRISGWRENYVYKLPSGEVIAIYNDVTEKKIAEEALKSAREWLGIALRAAHAGTWDWDFPSGRLTWSPEFFELFGLPPGATPSFETWLSVLHPDDREPAQAKINQSVQDHTYLWNEYRIILPDSHVRWIGAGGGTTYNDAGEPLRMSGVCIDITERKLAEEALRESEERYISLFNRSLDCIYIHDLEGNFLDANASALDLLGYSRKEIPHMSIRSLLVPDHLEKARAAMKTIVRDGSHSGFIEYRLRCKDGRFVDIETTGTLIVHDGKPYAVFGIARDITERRQAEEQFNKTLLQLKHSEALLRKVYDILPIGLWLADKNGKLFYGNPAGVKIWGAEPHVPLGEYGVFKARRYPSGEEIVPDEWALAHTILKGVTIKDELLEIDAFDGTKKIILNYTAPLYDATGTIDGAIVVNQEITDKVKTEQALLENQARLATAMDIAGLVNWEYDVATGMFTFDDRFYNLYETTADREGGNQMTVETYMREFVYPADRPAVAEAIQKILSTTDPAYSGQIEHRITPRDGSIRTIIARFAPVMGPDGKVIKTFGANQDITDHKLMEEEIRSLNRVLEQRVRDRTEALSKVNEALEKENAQRLEAEKKLQGSFNEKVVLLKEIHHRVKNNLQIIASLLNLQSRYIKDEQSLAAIRESQNRVKAMALVHEKLYRAEDIAHISLYDYIKYLGNSLFQFYGAKSRGIRFTLEIHDVDVDIDAAIPLGLITNELISNSLKYAFPEGRKGEIFISVKKEDHTLTILFRDTGIGIPADLDWRNTQSLGLRLVITLVEQMTGTVELDRSSGTQFTLVLHEKT
jgi:PAS domain S-box-containing protein